jgi:hypothetical protein
LMVHVPTYTNVSPMSAPPLMVLVRPGTLERNRDEGR